MLTPCVGIDPGNEGGVAVYSPVRGILAAAKLAHNEDGLMIAALGEFLAEFRPRVIAIEEQTVRHTSRIKNVRVEASLNQEAGALWGACRAWGYTVRWLKPAAWQRITGLRGAKTALTDAAYRERLYERTTGIVGASDLFKGPRGGVRDGICVAALLAYLASEEAA